MALDFTALEAQIGRLPSVADSVDQLLDKLFAEFEANKNAPAKIQALVDKGRAEIDRLAASVVESTPAANEAPPVNPPAEPPMEPPVEPV